jgi:hypothetical protein
MWSNHFRKDFFKGFFNFKESPIFDSDNGGAPTINRGKEGGEVLIGREYDDWLTGNNLLQKFMRAGAG